MWPGTLYNLGLAALPALFFSMKNSLLASSYIARSTNSTNIVPFLGNYSPHRHGLSRLTKTMIIVL